MIDKGIRIRAGVENDNDRTKRKLSYGVRRPIRRQMDIAVTGRLEVCGKKGSAGSLYHTERNGRRKGGENIYPSS